jgi:hypothetical protein
MLIKKFVISVHNLTVTEKEGELWGVCFKVSENKTTTIYPPHAWGDTKEAVIASYKRDLQERIKMLKKGIARFEKDMDNLQ